jgi:uncharacterized membrane protein
MSSSTGGGSSSNATTTTTENIFDDITFAGPYFTITYLLSFVIIIFNIWFFQRRELTPIRQRSPLLMVISAVCATVYVILESSGRLIPGYPCFMRQVHLGAPVQGVLSLYLWRAIDLVYSFALTRYRLADATAQLPAAAIAHQAVAAAAAAKHKTPQTVASTATAAAAARAAASLQIKANWWVRHRHYQRSPKLAIGFISVYACIFILILVVALNTPDYANCASGTLSNVLVGIMICTYAAGLVFCAIQLRQTDSDCFGIKR